MRALARSVVAFLLAGVAATAADDMFAVTLPASVVTVDLGKLKGALRKLTWSKEDGEFYIEVVDDAGKSRGYLAHVGSTELDPLEAAPDWAGTYWQWKSTRNVPGNLDVLIEVRTADDAHRVPSQSLRQRAAAMSDGTLARQGAADAANDMNNASRVTALVLKGQLIGEYVDAPVMPGSTFGWSPERLHAVAFVAHSGRLMLMDVETGRKQEIADSDGATLPAWSLDGSKIVFFRKTGRKSYALMQVGVTRR